MKLLSFSSIYLLCLTLNSAYTQDSKQLLCEDATYEFEIRTVQLYPNDNKNWNVLDPPVARLGNVNLVLEFDDLVKSPEDYRARIIHCNADWTKSRLNNIEYLFDYNEFNIRNDETSTDTRVSYIHYTFSLPQVKLPGNYLLVVYRGGDESDIILSRRFMVYSNQVNIQPTSPLTGLTSTNRSKQQIDFKVLYENYEILNPLQSVSVTVRKNERWDNAITNLKPSFIREHISELEYRFFNFENSFLAGNEYRFFDMRSLLNPGQGVYKVVKSTYPTSVILMADKPRVYEAYSHLPDINGDYYIVNVDAGNGDTYSDYVTTRFTLKSETTFPGDVYVVGKMNNWKMTQDNRMSYDRQAQAYTTDLILKQGWYDYKYAVKSDSVNYNYIEGNHFQAENTYEILVYHRPLNRQADLLIGYGYFEMNPRQ